MLAPRKRAQSAYTQVSRFWNQTAIDSFVALAVTMQIDHDVPEPRERIPPPRPARERFPVLQRLVGASQRYLSQTYPRYPP